MLKPFLQYELGKGSKYFQTNTLAKSITAGLFLAVFIVICYGIYKFFISGFDFINGNLTGGIALPITLFFYEIFLLILAGLIVLSCMVSSIFKLFRGQDDNWVISSPAFKSFPRMIFVRSTLVSMWPLFVVFLPAILAFNQIYNLGVVSLLFIFLSFFLLLLLLNALTLAAIILLALVYYKIAEKIRVIKFSFKGLIALILLSIALAGALAWKATSDTDIVKLFRAEEADTNIDISVISERFKFLPTHPFAMEIVNWQNRLTNDAMTDFSILALFAAVSIFAFWIVSIFYYPVWQKLQEGGSGTVAGARAVARRTVYRFRGGKVAALFKKEALVFTRNMRGILWFIFLFSIWLAQIGSNVILSRNLGKYQQDISQRISILEALQFIIAVYFICSFALRFVFPSFSLEKKTAWILASAPLNFKKIFIGKYLFYASFFLAVGIIMGYINVTALNLPVYYAAYTMLLFVAVITFIIAFALSLGALFPNYETDDPEIISTSMSGLFFTALTLIYGAMGDWTLYTALETANVMPLVLFVALTFSLVIMILAVTPMMVRKRAF